MAFEVPVLDFSFSLNVSTTAKQFYLVKPTTAETTVTLTTSAGEAWMGVVQEASSSGGTAAVRLLGITKVAHDGTLTPGSQVAASSAGLATAPSTAAGVYRGGFCIAAGSTVSGTIATVFLCPQGQST